MSTKSVAIHHPDDPKRPKVIPADQYDSTRHTLWEECAREPVLDEVQAELNEVMDAVGWTEPVSSDLDAGDAAWDEAVEAADNDDEADEDFEDDDEA